MRNTGSSAEFYMLCRNYVKTYNNVVLKLVTYVPNTLTKVTIIVDIGVLGFNDASVQLVNKALLILSFALETRYEFATNLLRLSQSGLFLFFHA